MASRHRRPAYADPALLKEFGSELRYLINSKEVFALLDDGDWGAGGCWTLAQALVEYLGAPAELMTVSERRSTERGMIEIPVSHVIVQYGDLYIDYNGAQTEEELFANLEQEGYEDPELWPFTPGTRRLAAHSGVSCDQKAKRELLKYLTKTFGS